MVVHPDARHIAFPAWEPAPARVPATVEAPDDLFERTAPLYAFMREHLFRDDTDRLARALWPGHEPPPGTLLLEVGCGPGVYARRLAAQHRTTRTVGVDRSAALVAHAAARATAEHLTNCRFQQGDALALDWPDASVDAVIASRLFTVVDGRRALAEIYRVLRPGGRCVLAEPDSILGTVVPFMTLRLAGWLAGIRRDAADDEPSGYQPHRLSKSEFVAVVQSQAWSDSTITRADGYLYAICQKPSGDPT